VAERHAFGGLLGANETGAFRRFQASSPAVGGDRPDQAQVAGAVKDG
jgi:hypothetical protein